MPDPLLSETSVLLINVLAEKMSHLYYALSNENLFLPFLPVLLKRQHVTVRLFL